jgi:hypothetical protein
MSVYLKLLVSGMSFIRMWALMAEVNPARVIILMRDILWRNFGRGHDHLLHQVPRLNRGR